MEIVKYDKILSVNSEMSNHEAKNLLQHDISVAKSWLCEKGTEKAVVIIKMERASVLVKLDIGNAHSAFIEVQVGRASDSTEQYQTLIPTSTFMTPNESKASLNKNQVRFFSKDDFDQAAVGKRWDVLKVVCSQPFDKHVPYGLCFIKVHSEKAAESIPLKKLEEPKISVGSFFKKRKEEATKSPSITDRIKEAAKPEALLKHKPMSASKIIPKIDQSSSKDKSRKADDENGSDNRRNCDFGLDDDSPKKLGSGDETLTNEETPSTTVKRQRDDEIEKKESERKKIRYDKTPRRDAEDERSEEREKEQKKKEMDKKRKKEIEVEILRKKVEEEKRKRREKDKENERKGKDTSRSKRKRKPFHRLLEDVVFVLSGYQNPERATYRSHAIAMGAKYRQDWQDATCTHLIAAYMNTPKCNEVKGKGKIVKKDWVEKCYNDKKRYPWRRFALDKNERRMPESEDEIDLDTSSHSQNVHPSTSTSSHSSISNKASYGEKHGDAEYDKSTDDEDSSSLNLPDFFRGYKFYVDDNISEKKTLERYIIAYNGCICPKLNDDVKYYITLQRGGLLDILKKRHNNLLMVSPTWIQTINCSQKFVPAANFLAE